MSKVITETRFKELKIALKNGANRQTVANRQHVSLNTLRRVNKSKNYAAFKEQLVKERGPAYATRRGKTTTWTQQVSAAPTPPAKKKGLLGRFFGGR